MKKRILMLTLVLMIVLSSFCISSAATYTLQPGSTFNTHINDVFKVQEAINNNIGINITPGTYAVKEGTKNPYYIDVKRIISFYESGGNHYVWFCKLDDTPIYTDVTNNEFPFYFWLSSESINTTNPINLTDPSIITVSIKPSQRILFNYAAADKDKFLKSLSCTPDKSITVHQGYYSDGQVTDLVIKKDTTGSFIGGSPVTLASFPSHRALNTNEYLGYSQANGGNWVWTDYIPGSSGGPVGTDSNSLVTFTIDTRYCSYRVVSANTGLEITSGGIANVPQVPDDGIYNNNQNPWGPGDITDDYLLDRADYEDGIIGDIQYGFDTLFKFLKMPFELLYKFIMTLGEIIQYALGTVSGFTTALQGIYAILPGPIWFLVIMAISINVFKLIFGR